MELAWSLYQWAMSLARRERGPTDAVASMLDEALDLGEQLGLVPLVERVQGTRRGV